MNVGRKAKDLTKEEFKYFAVKQRIDKLDRSGQSRVYWECKCNCGESFIRRHDFITSGKCNSCGCRSRNFNHGKEHVKWKGHGEISGHYFGEIKNNAKYRNLEFDLTIEFIWELYQKQQGKCALSNISIKFKQSKRTNEPPQTASLDRIDGSKGYTLDNVQWVHKDVNTIKNKLTDKQLIRICGLIAKHNIGNDLSHITADNFSDGEHVDESFIF